GATTTPDPVPSRRRSDATSSRTTAGPTRSTTSMTAREYASRSAWSSGGTGEGLSRLVVGRSSMAVAAVPCAKPLWPRIMRRGWVEWGRGEHYGVRRAGGKERGGPSQPPAPHAAPIVPPLYSPYLP